MAFWNKKQQQPKTQPKSVANESRTPKPVEVKKATKEYIRACKEFETTRIGEIKRSRQMAWYVAMGAVLVAIAEAIAIAGLTPLKETRPYVIRVDNNTGATDIVTMLENGKESQSDVVARYFAGLYVTKLESYDWYTIQSQYNDVMMFSDSNTKNQIKNRFAKPDAPHKVYKENSRIEVKIHSISKIGDDLLQIRFVKSLMPMNGGSYDPTTGQTTPEPQDKKYIATLAYEYINVPTLDDVRRVNPLGFTVKSYQVNEDSGF